MSPMWSHNTTTVTLTTLPAPVTAIGIATPGAALAWMSETPKGRLPQRLALRTVIETENEASAIAPTARRKVAAIAPSRDVSEKV